MQRDPYEILQLPNNSSFEQIKERYRHLSKYIHPDKQPLENYVMAQEKFKNIDEAFKSISTPLRRYIFRNFGYIGITILNQCPYDFKPYENTNLNDVHIQAQINQLVYSNMYQLHAMSENDHNKFKTQTIMLVHRPLNQIAQFPSILQNQFNFEIPLPNFCGMAHTLNISQTTTNNENQKAQANINFSLNSVKRINQTVMLSINSTLVADKLILEAGLNKSIGNDVMLHFNFLEFDGEELGRPQVGFDFKVKDCTTSLITDFQNLSMQFSQSTNDMKKPKKIFKLSMNPFNFFISPQYQRKLNQSTTMIMKLDMAVQQLTRIHPSFYYGYRLNLHEDLKLQVGSNMSFDNKSLLKIAITTSKCKVSIPIYTYSPLLQFEAKKIIIMITTYILFNAFEYISSRSSSYRKRLEFQNFNRLEMERNLIMKINNQASITANDLRQKETRDKGLVILLCLIGNKNKLKEIETKIERQFKRKDNIACDDELEESVKIFRQLVETNNQNFQNQIYDITNVIQSKVLGAHLMGYNVKHLNVNPCLNENQPYWSLTFYWIRGKLKVMTQPSHQQIKIGSAHEKYKQTLMSSCIGFIKNLIRLI